MKMKLLYASTLALSLALTINAGAQTVTNPNPNRVISWNLDDWSTVNPTDLAGLAPATNWVDTYLNSITIGLPDNTGAATTLNLGWGSVNTWHVQANHVGYDANGTANREMLNGYLNAGPAAWNTNFTDGLGHTNTFVSLTNIPYAKYDVVVYFNSDTSGRHASIDNGSTKYYFSTVGSPSRSGANALFAPTTQTNNSIFPSADFAFFPGMTSPNAMFIADPKSGNDQWLGIAAFQVIESSNVYVLYGPSPANQIVPLGQSTSFSVMAGGLTPQYQWRHAGTNLLNATNAIYTIASTVTGQDGNYDVIISNSFSSVTSVVSTLTFYTPKTVEWDGIGSTWDTTSSFWTLNGGATTTNYTETDNVLFSPLGAAQSYVSLATTLMPSSITVSNAAYTLASGALTGPGSLRVRNNGTLILDTADTRTGPTLIDAGSTLQLDNGDTAGSLGAGAMTNNGALVFNAGGDEAYGYPIYGAGSITNISPAGTITLGNNLSANYLVEAGGGILLLQGSNTFSGGLVVSSGTMWARAANCLGLAPITVVGGELQLIFNIDFTGTSMTLAGGLLHAGIGGSPVFEGQVILAADSTIQVDGGSTFTLPNAAGLNGGNFNLTTTGAGTLILGGATNSWNSLTISGGAVAFNSAANQIITSSISGPGNLSQLGSGTTTLSGDNSGMFGNLTVSAGALLVNATSGAAAANATGGALGGNGTITGPVAISPGATLAPGTATIGTLTLNSDLTLGGNVLVKVNKSLSQSNDFVSVAGVLSNTNNGVVTVNNLGPALQPGDKFTLFSQPVSGGSTLDISGGGVTWSNNLANDGSIIALSVAVPKPVIRNISISGGNLIVSGTNGTASATCYLLSSTNLTTPLANWTRVSTNTFDASGNFSITNAIGGSPRNFYILQVP